MSSKESVRLSGPGRCWDVAVVGAGPAGAAAADRLARGGAQVVLLEKYALPRRKVCGGGLVARAAAAMTVDIGPAVEWTCRRVELTMGPRPLRFMAEREDAVVVMVDRACLDHLLVKEARRRGVEVRQCCPVTGIRIDDGSVVLKTSGGFVRARWVVCADGAGGRLARMAGWVDTRLLVPALECSLHLPPWRFRRFSRAAGFDFGVLPRGYGWRFPKAERLDVGVVSMLPRPGNLKHFLWRYLKRLGLADAPVCDLRAAPIPVAAHTGGLARGRVLLVGDAAGLADPLTAEGISHAVRSGRLAADALLESGLDTGRVVPAYHRRMQKAILGELGLARFFARWVFGHPRAAERLFRLRGQHFVEGVTDIACGRSTYRSLLQNPLNHLRLLRPLP